MNRREFTPKVKAAAFLRSGGRCEKCAFRLRFGEPQYDHILECREGGTNDLDNCQVLCIPCHKGKSARSQTERAKADRGLRMRANVKERKGPALPHGRKSGTKVTWVDGRQIVVCRATGRPLKESRP